MDAIIHIYRYIIVNIQLLYHFLALVKIEEKTALWLENSQNIITKFIEEKLEIQKMLKMAEDADSAKDM